MKISKKMKEIKNDIDRSKTYTLEEGIKLVKNYANAKFDETIELAIKLGVDPRKSDQMVRGIVLMPYGVGKQKRVLVLTKDKQNEALDAGADWVGYEEYIEKVQSGWLEFDACVATPAAMKDVAKLGKILGPRGLMPNPKAGTVTNEVGKAVIEIKKGRAEFRMDKTGVIHLPVGKVSFSDEKLISNLKEVINGVKLAKPKDLKGNYMKSLYLSSTMGPGIRITS
ncbi:50S ribosomal protein L1 [candidate division WOR-3 bacterium]|nr:50S ribosomal protein L1 [candidate division WOR-3 bacterium]